MLFNKNLSKEEKLNFLEYLSFQIKSELSFEKALKRYLESSVRKDIIINKCHEAIELIRNGESPADALLDSGFIEKFEYSILKNNNSNKELYISLLSLININKGNLVNSNKLKSAIKNGIFTFCFILLLIPFFKDDIASLYSTFGQMQELTGNSDKKIEIELPFLIKYWWSPFILLIFIFVLWKIIELGLNFMYNNHANIYYRIFRNKLYGDLISVLKTLYQLQQSMSVSNSYLFLSKGSLNLYWENLFAEIDTILKQGGKASDIFIEQKGIIPLEVIYTLVDGEETSEMKLYINKAIEFCEYKNEEINLLIKEWAPTIINLVLFLIIGGIIVLFVKDMTQNGIMDIMSKM